MAKRRVLTESTYNELKMFLNKGIDSATLIRMYGFSNKTISRIKNSDSFEDYKVKNREMNERYRKPVPITERCEYDHRYIVTSPFELVINCCGNCAKTFISERKEFGYCPFCGQKVNVL